MLAGVVRLSLIFIFVAALAPVVAEEEEPKLSYYTRKEFRDWRERLRGFDELRMTRAEKWSPYPVGWDKSGSIKFSTRRVLNTLLYAKGGITDSDSLLALLEFEPNVPKVVHGCYGLFNVFLYRKGELIGVLHYAHGQYWHPLTTKSQTAISRWLTEHGFPIDETLKLEVRKTPKD